jgi:beta-mannanase
MNNKTTSITLVTISLLFFFTACDHQNNPDLSGEWDGCVVGMFTAAENGHYPSDGMQAVVNFEKLIDHQVGSVMWFCTWDDTFPANACAKAYDQGILPHITWELFWPSINPNNARTVDSSGYAAMDEILAGNHDEYINNFALAVKEYSSPVLIRFMHEFNGNWYVWSGNKNGGAHGGPAKVIAVWQYVVDRFKTIGAANAQWLWTPHGPSIDRSTEEWNEVQHYWPGDKYVDWIGLDGYNFYPKDPWGNQRPFRDFDNCAKLGRQPMIVAEFGTGEFEYENKTKADWISDAFSKIENEYPRVKIFTWFHINKEHDWRVNSSPEALKAFQKALSDPYFIGSPLK